MKSKDQLLHLEQARIYICYGYSFGYLTDFHEKKSTSYWPPTKQTNKIISRQKTDTGVESKIKLSSILNSFMSDLEKPLVVSKHSRQNVDFSHAVWPDSNQWQFDSDEQLTMVLKIPLLLNPCPQQAVGIVLQ